MNVNDVLLSANWPAPQGVVAGCSLRSGGTSDGPFAAMNLGAHVGDDVAAVAANRQRFVDVAALPAEPRWLNQVHGTRVVADPANDNDGDAAWTDHGDVVCAVMIADCLPVLFCSDDGREVAAAHAGWRGLAAGILERTVAAFGVPPERLLAWLGPAISQPAFEVGDEVREAFVGADNAAEACFVRNDNSRWQADLFGLARQRLMGIGVTNIAGGGQCTYGDPERFYSYRRDGKCGRMAAYVFRRP